MGYFYFDESVHPDANFILGAFAYSESALEAPVAEALLQSGLEPRVDEFKSGARMCDSPAQVEARGRLTCVIQDRCRIGLVIVPGACRPTLGNYALQGLSKILTTNRFKSNAHEAFFDRGIFQSVESGKLAANHFLQRTDCEFRFEQDSRLVMGLQVADLIAHTCATMLRAQLGLVKKMVKAGENSGYDPELQVNLDFKLWAGLRYKFFAASPPPVDSWESQLDFQVEVESRGLLIADSCAQHLREAALTRFRKMYLGCIH